MLMLFAMKNNLGMHLLALAMEKQPLWLCQWWTSVLTLGKQSLEDARVKDQSKAKQSKAAYLRSDSRSMWFRSR